MIIDGTDIPEPSVADAIEFESLPPEVQGCAARVLISRARGWIDKEIECGMELERGARDEEPVYVIMHADFPDCVMRSPVAADKYVNEKNETERREKGDPLAGYWRVHRFPVQG